MKYKTLGVCSTEIEFEIKGRKIKNVKFHKGCDGNLKAIGILVDGMEVEEVIEKLKGITCGAKGTSCADQLAKVLEQSVELKEKQKKN